MSDINKDKLSVLSIDENQTIIKHPDSSIEKSNYNYTQDELFENSLNDDNNYQMLKLMVKMLKQQLLQSYKDIEKLEKLRTQSFKDPSRFSRELLSKKINLPKYQKIVHVPDISMENYKNDHEIILKTYKELNYLPYKTVASKLEISAQKREEIINSYLKDKPEPKSEEPQANKTEKRQRKQSRHWTKEEEKKLLELLEVYKDEPIQAQKYIKISNELKTRTPQQIHSKIQNTLSKNNSNSLKNELSSCTTFTHKNTIAKKAGNFLSFSKDGKGFTRISGSQYLKNVSFSSPMSNSVEFNSSNSVKIEEDLEDKNDTSFNSVHIGFKCSKCSTDPIVGHRYTCKQCSNDINNTVHLCRNCFTENNYISSSHII